MSKRADYVPPPFSPSAKSVDAWLAKTQQSLHESFGAREIRELAVSPSAAIRFEVGDAVRLSSAPGRFVVAAKRISPDSASLRLYRIDEPDNNQSRRETLAMLDRLAISAGPGWRRDAYERARAEIAGRVGR